MKGISFKNRPRGALWIAGLAATVALPAAAFELGAAETWQLDNGLTVIALEDHGAPVVSVQALYRVGARDEDNGRTGLAHFLEHMAYRATANFPGTGVASSIYAVGGEWHGYTWIDQTTYFETVPAAELDLALRIEADRMQRLAIAAEDVDAERGAVLAELHGYENDPASVLHDAVVATALLQHPYRNNTIGWESDVAALGHDDLVEFYRRHYRASNAVLAVVGDFDAGKLRGRVAELYGGFAALPPTRPPATVEPPQRGERRIVVEGAGDTRWFESAWPAPAAGSADFAAFLVLQEALAGGSGVNFRQSDGITPAREDSLLAVAAAGTADLRTWLAPAAFPYLFSIAGNVPAGTDESAVEQAIERAVGALRDRELTDAALAEARAAVLAQLVFDVGTTEDAAHELAYFSGLGALAQRLALPARVAAVSAADVRRVARDDLAPGRRTIGWYRAGAPPAVAAPAPAPVVAAIGPQAKVTATGTQRATRGQSSPPSVTTLARGPAVLVQRNPASPAAYVGALVPGTDWDFPDELRADSPVAGYTALGLRCLPGADVGRALDRLRKTLAAARPAADDGDAAAGPEAALAAALDAATGLGTRAATAPARPATIVVVGDIDPRAARAAVEKRFTGLGPARIDAGETPAAPTDQRIRYAGAGVQAQVGYVVPAPGAASPDSLAWQLALYVLSHGYEGRLGLEAINRRGLAYDIDARYESDGARGRVVVSAGVDPSKLAEFESVLRGELRRLREQPPGAEELAEARRHFVGRELTAAQGNEEIAAELARQWLWRGRLRPPGELARELGATTDDDVRRILPAFTGGAIIVVEVGP